MSNQPLHNLSDSDFVERAANEDPTAIRFIVEAHQNMVYGTCFRILRNGADAEDATQATFLLFLKKCGTLKRGTVIGGWLYKTACLVSRQHLLAKRRRAKREEAYAEMQNTTSEKSADAWKDLLPELDAAIRSLPQAYQNIVILRYLEGLSTAETVKQLGMTDSAVSTGLSRGVDKMRTRFRRKGIVLSAAALASSITTQAAECTMPKIFSPLIGNEAGSGTIAATVSPNVIQMVQGVASHMTKIKLLSVAIPIATAATLTFGAIAASSKQSPAPVAEPVPIPMHEPRVDPEAESTEQSDQVILREVDTNGMNFGEVTGRLLWVFADAESVAKHVEDPQTVKALVENVDFKTQNAALFHWMGSGGDKLSVSLRGNDQKAVAVYDIARGKTKDLREHTKVYAISKVLKIHAANSDKLPVSMKEADDKTGEKPGVAATLVLSMYFTAPGVRGPSAKLNVDADGSFYHYSNGRSSRGILPKVEVERLIQNVANAKEGSVAEDAGHVKFTWMEDEQTKTRSYTFPARSPCKELMAQIDGLVLKYRTKATK